MGLAGVLISEFHQRGPALSRVGLAHLGLFGVLLIFMAFDPRQVAGFNVWLKPAKFALSIGVYLLTMAWLMGEIRRARRAAAVLAGVIVAAMILEQSLITLQAARGTSSHYNHATPFDSAVFSLMGLGVAANSAAAFGVFLLFMAERRPVATAYVAGIRLGLLIFLLGSVQGFVMIAHGGHTVGAADGGPGIPLVGWSSVAGDLRVAHFIGIHALQVLPFLGLIIDRWSADPRLRVGAALLAAAAYLGLGLAAFDAAVRGRPLA